MHDTTKAIRPSVLAELDRDAVERLSIRIASAIRTHLLSRPAEPAALECLNALAMSVALLLCGTEGQARDFWDAALDLQIAEVEREKMQ